MGEIHTWRDLLVWQKAHGLVLQTYQYTRKFPIEEKFGLTAQIRRAAVSVTSNIVEGFHRKTVKDSVNFYSNASGSLEELRYQCLLSLDLGYIDVMTYQDVEAKAEEVSKMLVSMSQQKNAGRVP